MNKNKKGAYPIMGIFIFIAVLLVVGLVLGFSGYVSNKLDTAISSQDIMAGQVNFTETWNDHYGQLDTALTKNMNWLGLAILFGLIIGLFTSAYFRREKAIPLFIILDIFLIFIAFIVGAYVSDAYGIVIGINELSTQFVQNLGLFSKMMLNLPIITTIIGALMMIITYSGIPSTKEEQIAGY